MPTNFGYLKKIRIGYRLEVILKVDIMLDSHEKILILISIEYVVRFGLPAKPLYASLQNGGKRNEPNTIPNGVSKKIYHEAKKILAELTTDL